MVEKQANMHMKIIIADRGNATSQMCVRACMDTKTPYFRESLKYCFFFSSRRK
jgi:hypothetical protein